MRKLLLFTFTFAALASSAQSLRLKSIISSDELESNTFEYNEDGKVASRFHVEDWYDGFVFKDVFTYNELGQLVEDNTWQELADFTDLKNVCRLKYTYDEQGRLKTRDNYNVFNMTTFEFEHSACIVYDYDDMGRKLRDTYYWANDLKTPFMYLDYTYDADDRLARVEETQYDMYYQDYLTLGATTYEYNSKGQLTKETYVSLDGVQEYPVSCEVYSYIGNDVVRHESQTGDGIANSRFEFDYDMTVPVSDVLYPESHEYKIESSHNFAHKRLRDKVWIADMDDVLQYSHDMNYTYEENTANAIQNVNADNATKFVYNVENGKIHLNGETMVRVMDMSGKTVLSTTSNSDIDLSSLPTGSYVVSTRTMGKAANFTKILVK